MKYQNLSEPTDRRTPLRPVTPHAWRRGRVSDSARLIPEEVAVAFTYNKCAYAVMMASPADLEDFAVGFSLAEGVVATPSQIRDIEIVTASTGTELRIWIDGPRSEAFAARRRYLAGPSGCGLCGLESLAEALRPPRPVTSAFSARAEDLANAMASLPRLQRWNLEARALHAAAFWQPDEGVAIVREDVGRHNALDKLRGSLARHLRPAQNGAVLLTSRVSVEMVLKAAGLGVPIVVAVSAPTSLALSVAEEAGITLIGVARDDGFEIFTHPGRIVFEAILN